MRRYMERFRQLLYRFMQGRYGMDKLNMVLFFAGLGLEVLYMIFGFLPLNLLSLILMGLAIFRSFSRNIQKRYAENQKFGKYLKRLKTLKTHHIYRCPSCRQKIRVPRMHGRRVEIRCPKCGQSFIKKA